ncbi:MAG TPA: hypothetical protein VKA27_13255 [Sunxiuqinia sp.]|nr:hypothetical protein [Sunxiuqinia sp.]
MKKIYLSFVLVCIVLTSFAQGKTQVGIYSEGGWFFPKKIIDTATPFKNGITAGVGAYISTSVWKGLSMSLGAGYRYRFNRQEGAFSPVYLRYPTYGYGGYGYIPYGYDAGVNYSYKNEWYHFPQSYIVVPLKLKYNFGQLLFLESGVEASWLLNYKRVTDNTGLNWLAGIGCDKYRIQFAVEYVQGFKQQGFWDVQDYPELGEFFRSRTLVLNLSCPLVGYKKNQK